MIARFINRQLHVWRWINFADIADYCAREPGSINPDPALMASTFKQLGDALAKGEFETDGRTRVIFLDASVTWFKMTQARFEGIPSGSRDAFYLKSCWIPQELCRRWFGARRIAPPPWLPVIEASVAARSGTACTTTAAASDTASLHPPLLDLTAAAKRDAWRSRVQQAKGANPQERRLNAFIAWNKEQCWPDGVTPNRDGLLEAHREDFGTIKGINEKTMRDVRKAIASKAEIWGGAPMHKRYRGSDLGNIPPSQVYPK